ncbi:hypothetical protein N7445_007249 [Penicillium cf. griseofulvum]|nr:hypothetical protein N7445_007249 [Penicillium cf. griseofulvum]
MPRRNQFQQKFGKGPDCEEENDVTKNRRTYCCGCGKFEISSHPCFPTCRKCGKQFAGGTGCHTMAFCGSFPCYGCCPQSPSPSPESHTNPALSNPEPALKGVDYPVLKITFPNLKIIMGQLYDFLLSDRLLEIDLDRKHYRAIFKAFYSRDSFIYMVYNTVLPEIRDLQDKVVTVDNLHMIRQEQIKQPGIWDSPHGGYLDFVPSRLVQHYWRPYIGQSGIPKYRVSTHHKNIQGGEQRQANFLRLWEIPFPPNVDNLVKGVFKNFLETVMCRAFHSLPPSTLEELFGSCLEGEYSGMGLNVVSPLYQGKRLATMTRYIIWSIFRKANSEDQSKWSPSRRPLFTRRDYCNLLREAMLNHSPLNLDQALPEDTDQIPWGVLGGEEDLEDPGSWFKTTIASLQGDDTSSDNLTPDDFIRPVGTSKASIGLVFGCVPPHTYKANDRSGSTSFHHLPWGLKESSLDESNSLIWSYSLQRFALIPSGFQSHPPNPFRVKFLKDSTQKLILRSKLRIIIMCGKEVEQVVLPDKISVSAHSYITFMLHNVECRAWVEHDGSIFRFISGITDVKLRPTFFESTLVFRGWYDEKLGRIPPISPQDLDSTYSYR